MKGKYIITIEDSVTNFIKVRFDGELEHIDSGVKFVLAQKKDISKLDGLYRFVANDAVGRRLFHEESDSLKIRWDHKEFLSDKASFSLEYAVTYESLESSLRKENFIFLNLKEFLLLPETKKLRSLSLEGEDVQDFNEDFIIEFRFPASFHVFHTLLKDVTLKREKFLYSLNDQFNGHDSSILMGNYESDGFAIEKSKFYFNSLGPLSKLKVEERLEEIIKDQNLSTPDTFFQLIFFEDSESQDPLRLISSSKTIFVHGQNLEQILLGDEFQRAFVEILS